MLARLLAVLLLPGDARADHTQFHRSALVMANHMRTCSPVVDVQGDDEVAMMTFEFSPWAKEEFDVSEFRERGAMIAPNRQEIVGNSEIYHHGLYDKVISFGRITRGFVEQDVEEAMRLSFERGVMVACFKSMP